MVIAGPSDSAVRKELHMSHLKPKQQTFQMSSKSAPGEIIPSVKKCLRQAQKALEHNDHSVLIEIFARLIKLEPVNHDHALNLARSYWHLKMIGHVDATLQWALEEYQFQIDQICVLAMQLLLSAHRIDLGKNWISRTIQSGSRESKLKIGACLPASLPSEQLRQIIEEFVPAAERDEIVLLSFATRMAETGLLNESKILISKLEKLDCRLPEFLLFRLDPRVSSMDSKSRLEHYDLLLERTEDDALYQKINLNKAVLLHKASRNDQAVKVVEALNDDPKLCCLESIRAEFFFRHYEFDSNEVRLKKLMTQWQVMSTAPNPRKHQCRNHTKGLRLGFISANFGAHPVGYMTAGFFCESFKIPQVSTILFDTDPRKSKDYVAQTITNNVTLHIDISNMDDDQAIQVINSHDLDFLFDLDGLSVKNRAHIVLNQNAPVVKWVGGLIGSTFLKGVDYLITDNDQTPASLQRDFTEQLILMPKTYVTYTPPPFKIGLFEPPSTVNGFITFGCFNNAAKISNYCLKVWASLLGELDNSRLLLKDSAFDQRFACERVIEEFASHGIDRKRLFFKGKTDHDEHLKNHCLVDICLDPMPYSGGLCTLEAAFMGVPVITLAGKLLAHRHSTTHLRSIDCPELVTEDSTQYIRTALDLAASPQRLLEYRQTLREKLFKSDVLDHTGFTDELIKKMVAIKDSDHLAQKV